MASRDAQRYWNTCRTCGKRSYVGRKAARRARVKLAGEPLSAYRCPVGSGWHLGRTRPADRDRNRRIAEHRSIGDQASSLPSTCYDERRLA